jgi:phosphohistidine phosphatase
MVELYLIRHAIAAERGERWPDDTKRPLTAIGARRMRRAAKGLARMGVKLDMVLSSPLVRAHQTAEIIVAAYETAPQIATTSALAPGGRYAELLADLKKHSRRSRIALVGHEPDLGALAGRLAGFRRPLEFKKGAICRIDVDAIPPTAPAILRWFVTPSILRAVGK